VFLLEKLHAAGEQLGCNEFYEWIDKEFYGMVCRFFDDHTALPTGHQQRQGDACQREPGCCAQQRIDVIRSEKPGNCKYKGKLNAAS
jgi:hypothetical protein